MSDKAMETVLGGSDREVVFQDGRTECIRVRVLTVDDLNRYAVALEAEKKLVQLYTGKDAAWVDKLSPESLVMVLTEGDRLNSFLADLLALRLQRQRRLAPREFDQLLGSLNSAATSPPKPA